MSASEREVFLKVCVKDCAFAVEEAKRNRNNKPPNPQNGSFLIVFIVKDILSFEL